MILCNMRAACPTSSATIESHRSSNIAALQQHCR